MLTNAASQSIVGSDSQKPPLHPPKTGPRRDMGDMAPAVDTHDGERVHISPDAKALAAKTQGSGEVDSEAGGLSEIGKWAARVAEEVKQQQHKILEEFLKQSGKAVASGEGRFLIILIDRKPEVADSEENEGDAEVPEYWNAENTSDRIVGFATQMAEISGLDIREFAAKIKEAVGAGFDQAQQVTGELPGAAGRLNKHTRELVFSKLSKWLEEREARPYNQVGRNTSPATSEVPDGTADNDQ